MDRILEFSGDIIQSFTFCFPYDNYYKNKIQMNNQRKAEEFKQQGNNAYKAKDYKKAIQLYTKAIELCPKDPSFYSNRAICYYNLNEHIKCIEDCDKSINLNPNFIKAYRKKSQSLSQLLKFSQAVSVLKIAYNIEKDQAIKNQMDDMENYQSNYERFLVASEKNDFEEALSCITYLVNKIADNDDLKLYRVQSLTKTGLTDEAQNLLKTIKSATNSNPDTFYLKGLIELYSGDSAKAKKLFTDGLRLDPDHLKCKTSLNKAKKCQILKEEGNQFLKANKYLEAQGKYSEALQLDPFNKKLNAIIYSNRALTYMKRKQNFKALDDLNKSLQLNPNYIKSLVRRAQLNMERGQYTAAISDYSKIEEVDPSSNMKAKIQDAQKKQKKAKNKDYYAILGLTKDAKQADLKKAYKALALKYHPDRNRGKSDSEQQQASRKFKDVAEAYGVLSDPKKKQMYDSGQMQYDGDQGAGFDQSSPNFQGFTQGFPGQGTGNGTHFTFKTSGNGMGEGFDPNEIFKQFFAGMGGMGNMGNMGGMGGMGGPRGKSGKKGGMGFNFADFGGF